MNLYAQTIDIIESMLRDLKKAIENVFQKAHPGIFSIKMMAEWMHGRLYIASFISNTGCTACISARTKINPVMHDYALQKRNEVKS